MKLTLVLCSGPAGLWQLAAALWPHDKCTAFGSLAEATTNALRCGRGSGGGGGGGGGGRRSRAEAARVLCSITAILVRICGLGTARFAELAAGAGACLRRLLKRRKLAPTKRVTASRIFRRGLVEFTPPLS